MTSKPEYLKFVEAESKSEKTRVWEVRSVNSDVLLGRIAWFGRWRQYTFWPEPETTFNPSCMKEIAKRTIVFTRDHFSALRRRKVEEAAEAEALTPGWNGAP